MRTLCSFLVILLVSKEVEITVEAVWHVAILAICHGVPCVPHIVGIIIIVITTIITVEIVIIIVLIIFFK